MEANTNQQTDDGAGEKLFDEPDNKPTKETNVEIKYVSENQNGDTKMDCDDMRKNFVGMGKEELMKFAYDPFWVKMRMLLFVLFWILWVGMLVGAVAIVLYAPKCDNEVPSPNPWFQSPVIYKINIRALSLDDYPSRIGKLLVIKDNIDYFQNLGVNAILLNSLMEGAEQYPETVKNFANIESMYGSFEILQELAKELKEKDIHLIMSFIPNYTSDKHKWFQDSVARIEPYIDYYVWAKGSFSDNSQPAPPNNWRSLYGDSAWTWAGERKQFYLHQFREHQPELNFHNPDVVKYFEEIFKLWMSKGLDGFYVHHANYLVEDSKLENETINTSGKGTHTDYDFYQHSHTSDLSESREIIEQWGRIVKQNSGILYVEGLFEEDDHSSYLNHHIMEFSNTINVTAVLHKILAADTSKPVWEWKCKLSCPDEEIAKGLLSLFLLLPGTVIMNAGEELPWPTNNSWWTSDISEDQPSVDFKYFLQNINQSNSDRVNSSNNIKTLLKLRNEPAFKEGNLRDVDISNSSVLLFTRNLPGVPGYLIAMNFADDVRQVNLQAVVAKQEFTVLYYFRNMSEPHHHQHSNALIESSTLEIDGKSLVVLKFSETSEVTSDP